MSTESLNQKDEMIRLFCKTCGRRLIKKQKFICFDGVTGEPYFHEIWYCPSWDRPAIVRFFDTTWHYKFNKTLGKEIRPRPGYISRDVNKYIYE